MDLVRDQSPTRGANLDGFHEGSAIRKFYETRDQPQGFSRLSNHLFADSTTPLSMEQASKPDLAKFDPNLIPRLSRRIACHEFPCFDP